MQYVGDCLIFASAGGAVVLLGAEEQVRVSKAARDVRMEPGGSEYSDVRELWICYKTEVTFNGLYFHFVTYKF